MLTQIHIENFAIIDNLDLEIPAGMTVITGETGAGKSVVIDALDIALGDRADSQLVKRDASRCEIHIHFAIEALPQARRWLDQQALSADNECLIRRSFSREGRSRSYINGHPVTLQQLRDLGQRLVHVHGQHQHQALLKRDEQRDLLDAYAKHSKRLQAVKEAYTAWHQTQQQIAHVSQQNSPQQAELDLLSYQIEELNQLALEANELNDLHQLQRQLANADHRQLALQEALVLLSDDNSHPVLSQLHQAVAQLTIFSNDTAKANWPELLDNAIIQVSEAVAELRHLADTIVVDPQQLQQVEQRLEQIHNIARKHRIDPEQIPAHNEALQQQLKQATARDEQLVELQQQAEQQWQVYLDHAKRLSKSREQAAAKLSHQITQSMRLLGMPKGSFAIECQAHTNPTAYGLDQVTFMVNPNPGQTLQPLAKVASGGELSRISLAIQVITAQAYATPTLVFDEVDVGIGGGIAEIVGQLLHKLGQSAQVICITHLPQVASQGDQHLQISKITEKGNTRSQVKLLNKGDRIQELARMLGGVKITSQSLAHAQEMLESTQRVL